jgi:hypothetical protein
MICTWAGLWGPTAGAKEEPNRCGVVGIQVSKTAVAEYSRIIDVVVTVLEVLRRW